METLIPEETPREERTGRNASEELLGSLKHRLRPGSRLFCLLPETFILLVVLWLRGTVDNVLAMEVANTADKIREHGLGEFRVFWGVEGRLGSKDLLETLREGLRRALDLFGKVIS